MKKTIATVVGTLVAAAVLAGGFVGFKDLRDHRQAASVAARYLYTPTDIKNDKGEALTRADLLDALIKIELAREQKAAALKAAAAPGEPKK